MSHRTQYPASPALAALFATDDAMPEALHSVCVYAHGGTAVALLGDNTAWVAWVSALLALPDVHFAAAQVGLHISTAEGHVSGCPVMVVAA